MTRLKYILSIALPSLFMLACNQEDALVIDESNIAFSVTSPATRASSALADSLLKYGFQVSAFCPDTDVVAGKLPICFENKAVTVWPDGNFRSNECKWPGNKGSKDGSLKFYAFYPSIPKMMTNAKVGNAYFQFSNRTTKDASGVAYDYRITKFRVAPDISKQSDFVTAIGEGNKTNNLYSTVGLAFEHQLCGVQIGVWGASPIYDVEIAGVRIGGTVVEADFSLSTVSDVNPEQEGNTIGAWYISAGSPRGYVDYIFTPGDKVVNINANEHNTKDRFASIMGNAGKAMLIPYKHDKWDYIADKSNANKGMYFSVLIHMTVREGDQHRVFPSTDPGSQDHIVYLSVRKSDGTVMKRLDKNGNVFGTSTKYAIPDTEELRHYGWAAVPVNVDWNAGYTYSYILDYSKGVGVHDPTDKNPAIPIMNWDGSIDLITPDTGSEWGNGEIIKYGNWGANTNNTAGDGTIWWK